jgi:NAD(P)-dependent dehydrogenase (short-subunit alcohol dehydrogenase family)
VPPVVIGNHGPDGFDEHPAEIMMRGTPAGRSGTPESIPHAAVYLASDEASFVHGSVIDIDGGRTTVVVIAS